MQGAAQALFVPLSLAVGFAMVSSYLLSSTFVPVLSTWLLRNHPLPDGTGRRTLFERTIDAYGRALVAGRPLAVGGPAGLSRAGRRRRHRRGTSAWAWRSSPGSTPGGFSSGCALRPERGSRRPRSWHSTCSKTIRSDVGADEVEISVGYIGLIPSSYPINAIFQWTGGPEEVVLRVALKEGTAVAVESLKERLRDDARREHARRAVLVRAGRHRQRSHELRLAHARGGRGQRPEPRGEPGVRREGPCGAGKGPVASRPPVRPVARLPDRERSRSTARRPGSAVSRSPRSPARWWRPRRRAGSSSPTTGPTPRPASATRCRSRSPTRS